MVRLFIFYMYRFAFGRNYAKKIRGYALILLDYICKLSESSAFIFEYDAIEIVSHFKSFKLLEATS